MTKPLPISRQHMTAFNNISPEEMNKFIITCFLNHKLTLIRNWGSTDEQENLREDGVSLLQFVTRYSSVTIEIRPKQNNITIHRNTKNSRKLYLYFVEILQEHRLRSKGTYREEERN